MACPVGKTAISGGAVVSGAGGGAPPAGVSLFRSEPTLSAGLPTGWAGGAHESVVTLSDWSLTVVVLCATVS